MTYSEAVRASASIIAFHLEGRPDEAAHLVDLMDGDELRQAVYGAGELIADFVTAVAAQLAAAGAIEFDDAGYTRALVDSFRAIARDGG